MVQAQNDFLAAVAGVNRAKSRASISEIIEKQNRTLYESKAGALRDFQTATADLAQAGNEYKAGTFPYRRKKSPLL